MPCSCETFSPSLFVYPSPSIIFFLMVFPFFFLFLNGILLHLLRFVSRDKHAVIRLDREENVEDKRETRFCYASSFWLIYRLWRRSHTRASTSHHWDIINFNTALFRAPTAPPPPLPLFKPDSFALHDNSIQLELFSTLILLSVDFCFLGAG